MHRRLVFLCLWALAPLVSSLSKVYRVYHVLPKTKPELDLLTGLWNNATAENLDFWQPPSKVGSEVHVMVERDSAAVFVDFLQLSGLKAALVIPDVQRLIEEREKKTITTSADERKLHDSVSGLSFNLAHYHSYPEMIQFMYDLQNRYPSRASTFSIGRTHEGRPIHVLKVGKQLAWNGLNSGGRKPAIWIDGGIHAREWVSPASALYFIHQLITGYDTDPEVRELVDGLDWFIVPLLNPDGYEYSRSSSEPKIRLWRKNRSPPVCETQIYGTQRCCQGVDLNRNFDFHFGEVGSSSDPCDEVYMGTSAFSEPESRAVRDFILHQGHNFQAFITMHSYSQIWMYPYGHQRRVYPADVGELKSVAIRARAALQAVFGTKYEVGTGADTLYPASGGSDDWAKEKAGIKFVYLLELRPEEHVWDGFILNQREILPTAKETWEGIKIVGKTLVQRNVPRSGTHVGGVLPLPLPVEGNGVEEGRECRDRDPQCQWWASFGGCRVWRDMDVRCPRSCNFCPRHDTRASSSLRLSQNSLRFCRDDRKDCKAWTRLKLCSWVHTSCQKTCNRC